MNPKTKTNPMMLNLKAKANDDIEDDIEEEELPGEANNENTPEADSEVGLQSIIQPQGYRPSKREQALINEITEKYGVRPPNN
eukprot:scaffold58972_cov64-Attheya_sp.AAC.2